MVSAFSGLRIGVLALQGAFAEHVRMVRACGACAEEVRKPAEPTPDWMPLTASFCPAGKARSWASCCWNGD